MAFRIPIQGHASSSRKRNIAISDTKQIQEPLGPFEPNFTDDMTKEERIKALVSYYCYGSTHYQQVTPPLPDSYVCYRCGQRGHHIRDCPTKQVPPTPQKKEEPIPELLCCPICRELLREAAIVPCCGRTFCDHLGAAVSYARFLFMSFWGKVKFAL